MHSLSDTRLMQPFDHFIAIDFCGVIDRVKHIAGLQRLPTRLPSVPVLLNRRNGSAIEGPDRVRWCGRRPRRRHCPLSCPGPGAPFRIRVAANCSNSRMAMEGFLARLDIRRSFIVTAKIETLLGGEQVKSKKILRPLKFCGVNCSPVPGFRLSHNFKNVSRVTTLPGCKPNLQAPCPIQCPRLFSFWL